MPLAEQWGVGEDPTAMFVLGLLQGAANTLNGAQATAYRIANVFGAGLDDGDWSRNVFTYESDAVHNASKAIGGESLFTLATMGAGQATVVSKIGCTISRAAGVVPGAATLGAGVRVAGIGMGAANALGEARQFGQALAQGDGVGALQHGFLAVLGAADTVAAYQQACFAAGTPLLTPEGSRPIEQLRVGDWVLSRPEHDPEATPVPRRVEAVFHNYSPLLALRVGGRTIRTTAEHPFWVRGKGWTAAHELMAGDHLRSHDGRWVALEAVEGDQEAAPVYNLRVAEYHTYFVGDAEWGFSIWAHNANYPNADPATRQQGEQFRKRAEELWDTLPEREG